MRQGIGTRRRSGHSRARRPYGQRRPSHPRLGVGGDHRRRDRAHRAAERTHRPRRPRAPSAVGARPVRRAALPTLGQVGALRAQPRPHVLLPRLRPPGRTLRPRPHHPARHRRADPPRQHQVRCAENITCSRLSGPDRPAGPTNSSPTARSCGSAPPATATPDHRAAECSSLAGTPTHPYPRHYHTTGPSDRLTGSRPDHAHPQTQPRPTRTLRLHAERERNQRAIDEDPPPF